MPCMASEVQVGSQVLAELTFVGLGRVMFKSILQSLLKYLPILYSWCRLVAWISTNQFLQISTKGASISMGL